MPQKGAAGNLFFHFFSFFSFFFPKIDNIFMEKKKIKWKKKKIAAARLASILATRCTGNRIFFMDSLGSYFRTIHWTVEMSQYHSCCRYVFCYNNFLRCVFARPHWVFPMMFQTILCPNCLGNQRPLPHIIHPKNSL